MSQLQQVQVQVQGPFCLPEDFEEELFKLLWLPVATVKESHFCAIQSIWAAGLVNKWGFPRGSIPILAI